MHPHNEPHPTDPMSQRSGENLSPRVEILCLALYLTGLTLLLIWRWVGFQGSDDRVYVEAAEAWLDSFPAIGTTHWDLRYPVVLPISAVLQLFGRSEFTLAFANLLYFVGFLAVGYFFVRRWFGVRSALIWISLLGCLPGYLVLGTYVNVDLTELFFVSLSIWLYLFAVYDDGGTKSLIFAGLCAGLAFLSRETTAPLILLYAALFVFSPGIKRRRYLPMALASALVVILQLGYLTAMTGEPFYRQKISATHGVVNRGAEVQAVAQGGELIDAEGALSVSVFLDPFLVLFVSQKYGFLFYLGVAGFLALLGSRGLEGVARRLVSTFAGLFLIWFLFVAANITILYNVPRYYMACGFAASVPAAVFLSRRFEAAGPGRWVARILFAGFVGSGVFLLYLENTNPLFRERVLVSAARDTAEVIHVDPHTFRRSKLLLRWEELNDRVSPLPPGSGALVMYKPGLVEDCERTAGCTVDQVLPFSVQPGWTEVRRVEGPPRWIGKLLRVVGVDQRIPPLLLQKIEKPYRDVIFYRTS